MMPVDEAKVEWRAVASCPRLTPGEIHLWRARLDVDHNRRCELASTLNTRELDRASRFRFDRHRNRYVAGRGIVRELLGHYLGEPPSTIHFELGPYGKPSVLNRVDGKQLCFNYTDSKDMALYAFAYDCELGVDLESLVREIRYQRIAVRKFSEQESESLLRLPDHEGVQAFLACWTRKEAYGKAKGVGICYPLDSVELCAGNATSSMIIPDDTLLNGDEYWTLQQFHPRDDFIAAIVYAGDTRQLHYFDYESVS